MISTLAHFPVDPAYGTGAYRRRLQFVAGSTGVTSQVDDTHHSYWLTLDHEKDLISAISAGFNRAPTNMCPGSVAGLEALVGLRIDGTAPALLARLPRTLNCSHLTDLAIWASAHIHMSAIWDIEIPDQVAQPVWIKIERNGVIIHRWQIADFHVVAPALLEGNPLMSGFMKWANEAYSNTELIAATMLQRGLFVARGRQHVVDQFEPTPLAAASAMEGMCWAYSHERLAAGLGTLGYVRDFSHAISPETPPPHVLRRFKDS